MRTLLVSIALAATIVPAAFAQGVTPGGGVGRPLPRCSAVQPVCESRCNSAASTCKQAPGTTPSCAQRLTNCLKQCRSIACIR